MVASPVEPVVKITTEAINGIICQNYLNFHLDCFCRTKVLGF